MKPVTTPAAGYQRGLELAAAALLVPSHHPHRELELATPPIRWLAAAPPSWKGRAS